MICPTCQINSGTVICPNCLEAITSKWHHTSEAKEFASMVTDEIRKEYRHKIRIEKLEYELENLPMYMFQKRKELKDQIKKLKHETH